MYKVLVIEENVLFLHRIEAWLRLHAFETLSATTAQQAYKLAKLEKPDLILANYELPDGNGLEFLQKIRKSSDMETVPFLLMTRTKLENIVDWKVHLQRNEILLKPIAAHTLLELLHSKLQLAQLKTYISRTSISLAETSVKQNSSISTSLV